MQTALRVPGPVRQPALVAQTVVRHRALARWRLLRLGRQMALLERAVVVPWSPPRPAMLRERSVVELARLRLLPAWLLALPWHPLLRGPWHCPVLRERSVAERRLRTGLPALCCPVLRSVAALPSRSWARSLRARRVSSRVAEQTQPACTGQRPAKLERSDPA